MSCDRMMFMNGVMYTLKRVGLRDDPCGTPHISFLVSDVKGGGLTLCVLPMRK